MRYATVVATAARLRGQGANTARNIPSSLPS
jgi:hypothetical protein